MSYKRSGYPVLPVGVVSRNGKNGILGNAFECWDDSTGLLVQQKTWKGKVSFKVVVTAGSLKSTKKSWSIGDGLLLKHDQNFSWIGEAYKLWEVISIFSFDSENYAKEMDKIGKTSVSCATFK